MLKIILSFILFNIANTESSELYGNRGRLIPGERVRTMIINKWNGVDPENNERYPEDKIERVIGTRRNFYSLRGYKGSRQYFLQIEEPPFNDCNSERWSLIDHDREYKNSSAYWNNPNGGNIEFTYQFYARPNASRIEGTYEHWRHEFDLNIWDDSFDEFCFCTLGVRHSSQYGPITPCKILFDVIRQADKNFPRSF